MISIEGTICYTVIAARCQGIKFVDVPKDQAIGHTAPTINPINPNMTVTPKAGGIGKEFVV